MDQLFELFIRNGLRPLGLFDDAAELEQKLSRSELAALLMLQYREQLTMSELAAVLGAPLSTVTSLVQRLLRKGWLVRNRSADDQRVLLVRLTADGAALADQARTMMNGFFKRVQAALSPEELQQFLTLAVKVGKALHQGNSAKDGASGSEPNLLSRITIED